MYGLPPQALVQKQLPKSGLSQALHFTSAERHQLDADVSRIDIVAQLTPQTLPTLSLGKQVQSIHLLRLTLKGSTCSDKTLTLLNRIPQTLLFALAHHGSVRFALCYEKRTFVTEPSPEAQATIPLSGTSLDELWLHLVAHVAGLEAGSGVSLLDRIERREHLARLTAERDRTEKKMWAERQPHRRNELFARVQQLNEQIKRETSAWGDCATSGCTT